MPHEPFEECIQELTEAQRDEKLREKMDNLVNEHELKMPEPDDIDSRNKLMKDVLS